MILITGERGLIGSFLMTQLGGTILALPQNTSVIKTLSTAPQTSKATLIHLGWKSVPSQDIKNEEELSQIDISFSKKLIEILYEKYGSSLHIVFISTGGQIYPSSILPSDETVQAKPRSSYARAKLEVEKYIRQMPISSVVLRCANAWGGKIDYRRRNGLIDRAIYNHFHGLNTVITVSPEIIISIIHLADIVNAIKLSMELLNSDPMGHYLFNLASESHTINFITTALKLSLGCQFTFKKEISNVDNHLILDCSNAINHLKWVPKFKLNRHQILTSYNQYY